MRLIIFVLMIILMSSLVSASVRDVVNIEDLRIFNENTRYGTNTMQIKVSLNDFRDYDLEDVMITTMIPEVNVFHKIRLNLEDLDENSRIFDVELPYKLPKGEYPVRFLISTDDTKRVKYRYLIVY